MGLTWKGLKEKGDWERAKIALPGYDPENIAGRTRRNPVWVHFGIGNIFRLFIGGVADRLIRDGAMDRGITCAEVSDRDIVDQIYVPHDNLSLSVILKNDGSRDYRVIGSLGSGESLPKGYR